MRSADITFVILTRNEQANLGGCLASLPAASPKTVYDAESTDDTVAIARTHGAQVVSAPWRGFVAARRAAAALVTTPWTFMLDADERLTPELSAELERLEPTHDIAAYSVPRKNIFCGRWVRGAGWWPDRLVRLFRTGQATVQARSGQLDGLHESWSPQGACGSLDAPIEHRSYTSVAGYVEKFRTYTALEAGGSNARLGGVLAAYALAPLKMLWLLGPRRAALDGWRGFFIAAASAAYPAAVMTKARRQKIQRG